MAVATCTGPDHMGFIIGETVLISWVRLDPRSDTSFDVRPESVAKGSSVGCGDHARVAYGPDSYPVTVLSPIIAVSGERP